MQRKVADESSIDSLTTEDTVDGIIESFLGEIIFKATTQTCIQKAAQESTKVKQYLAYLEIISKYFL